VKNTNKQHKGINYVRKKIYNVGHRSLRVFFAFFAKFILIITEH